MDLGMSPLVRIMKDKIFSIILGYYLCNIIFIILGSQFRWPTRTHYPSVATRPRDALRGLTHWFARRTFMLVRIV
jgi:hypothetical protein